MKKRLSFIPIALMLAFAMVACGPQTPTEEPPTEEVSPDVEEPVVEVPEEPVLADEGQDDMVTYEEIVLTPMEAYDLYVDLYPDLTITKLELDKYFGSYVYKLEGYKDNEETEIKIDPINGDVIDTDTEVDDDLDKYGDITIANVEKIQVLLDKALVDAGPGSIVDEWTLEWDNGILKFEVDIDLPDSRDIDYTYNIETGELIEKDE